MRKWMTQVTIFALAVLPLAAVPAAAQQMGPKPTLSQVFASKAMTGHVGEFEAGVKKHMDWHRAQRDTWSYVTYQVMTGAGTGGYVSVTGGHQWADYDTRMSMMQADGADARMNIAPHAQSLESSFYQTMPEVSMTGTDASQNPAPMLEVIHFHVKIGKDIEFQNAIARTHEAIQKTKWPTTYTWYVLMNGGEGGHYVLVLPKKNFAEMQEPNPPFPVMLQQGIGGMEAARVMKTFDESLSSVWSEMLMYRADLSYVAGK